MQDFFTLSNVQNVIAYYRNMINNLTPENSFEKNRNEHISTMLASFSRNAQQWDQKVQVNINYIGDRFYNELQAKESNKDSVDEIFSSCFRFLLEYYINMPGELGHPLGSIKSFAIHHLDDFTDSTKNQIEYALREMPINILKDILHNADFKALRELPSITKHTETLKEQWNTELKDRIEKIDDLKETLKEYEHAFNFAGLFKGFLDLGNSKKKEARSGKVLLVGLAMMVPVPIIFETAYFVFRDVTFASAWDLIKILPAASMSLLLIYFFRISLRNYNSLKAQLLQIELRKTLCQFIQSYADYSKEIKSKEHNPLDKFEDVIFSNIMTAEEKIPSTFDGVDQLANMIKAIKGSKG
ncbi:hypothetical protein WKH29_11355 [Pantoea agglomerans]|jgi:hypothetical protein|uniref:hypothetical protein n=1 Tax=Enterobacter agglomerans TaxID=549 RepID=UPI003C7D94FE